MEGLGRGHRRHLVRQEFQNRLRVGNSAKGAGRSHQSARDRGKNRTQRRRGKQSLIGKIKKYNGAGRQDASFEMLDGSRARVTGALHFITVSALLAAGVAAINDGRATVIDLAGVTASDSAGLALLIEWLSVAKAANHALRFENIPSQLKQLARLSEVEELLVPAEEPVRA